jgi:hypothetical protein
MLFEIRKITFHSIQEFLREYLMIVVGILTALGLEHVIASHHHHQAAEQSRQQVVAELRANLDEIRQTRERNLRWSIPLAQLADSLKRDLKSGLSQEDVRKHLRARHEAESNIGFSFPTLRHDAWEVMVANQTAIYMDTGHLRRYSAAYAFQRDMMAWLNQASTSMMNDQQLLDVLADPELQEVDPRAFLKLMARNAGMLRLLESDLALLQGKLEEALKDEPRSASATGHASSKP